MRMLRLLFVNSFISRVRVSILIHIFLFLALANYVTELNSYKLAQFVNEFLENTRNQSNSQTIQEIQETIESVGIQDAEHPNEY